MLPLKAAAKQPRMNGQAQITRTESVDLASVVVQQPLGKGVVRSHPTAGSSEKVLTSDAQAVAAPPSHPKGHKARNLSEVWAAMDKQTFLHLTDTVLLGDVWVQPIGAETSSGQYTNVVFRQIVAAPNIKWRNATCKMAVDDLLAMLYLGDCIQWDMQAIERLTYDEWMKEKSANCVKALGMEEGGNRSTLCNFIITSDRDYTLYPHFLKGNVGLFFRKVCRHSYRNGEKKEEKLPNPSMIKCSSRGKFEFVLEVRIFPLPDKWFSTSEESAASSSAMEEVPASQVY